MTELELLLTEKAKAIESSPAKKEMVRKWVRGYSGRVIGFKTPGESYYLAFTADRVSLSRGEYPSCEYSYHGNNDTIVSLLNKQTNTMAALKSGKLLPWGSLSEAQRFEQIL